MWRAVLRSASLEAVMLRLRPRSGFCLEDATPAAPLRLKCPFLAKPLRSKGRNRAGLPIPRARIPDSPAQKPWFPHGI
jgi:hypothetical protein